MAYVLTDFCIEAELLQVQTWMQDGGEDARLLCSAIDGPFTNTYLIVDREAANMVAARAQTSFCLDYKVVIRIVI